MRVKFIIAISVLLVSSLFLVKGINSVNKKAAINKYRYIGIPYMDTAIYYLNKPTVELTGNNDGKDIKKFVTKFGGKAGDPWCAGFVSYCLSTDRTVLYNVRSLQAISFIGKTSIDAKEVFYGKKSVSTGWLVIWKKEGYRTGHVGFVWVWGATNGQVIEGNSGNKVSFLNRSIEPRNIFRIVAFTPVPTSKAYSYVPFWYWKTDNSSTNTNNTR